MLLAVVLMVRLGATAATPPPGGPDGVGFLGSITALSANQLVLNDGRGTQSIALETGTRLVANKGGALHIGAPVFVGAHHVNGRLVARVVENLGGLQIAPTASQKLMTLLKGTHPQQSSGTTGSATSGNCLLDFGFDPRSRC